MANGQTNIIESSQLLIQKHKYTHIENFIKKNKICSSHAGTLQHFRQGHKQVDAVVYDELIHLKTVEEIF